MNAKKDISMADLLTDQSLEILHIKRGDVVEGKVVEMREKEFLIDLGAKAEGILPFAEVDDVSSLKPGQKVLVYVITPEDRRGRLLLSESRALVVFTWRKLHEASVSGEVVEAEVSGFNKGGLVVDISGLMGFLPFSLAVSVPNTDLAPSEYQSALDKRRGTKVKVKVLEANIKEERIIVSERAAAVDERRKEETVVLSELGKGQVVTARIKQVLPFGLLVDLRGIDALIPKDEIAWSDSDLSSFRPDQEIEAKVLSVPEDLTGRAKLSIRQLSEDPWVKLAKKYKQGKRIKGKVTKVTSFGVVVQLSQGIDGLLPLSGLLERKERIRVGDELDLEVKAIDSEKRRLELVLAK